MCQLIKWCLSPGVRDRCICGNPGASSILVHYASYIHWRWLSASPFKKMPTTMPMHHSLQIADLALGGTSWGDPKSHVPWAMTKGKQKTNWRNKLARQTGKTAKTKEKKTGHRELRGSQCQAELLGELPLLAPGQLPMVQWPCLRSLSLWDPCPCNIQLTMEPLHGSCLQSYRNPI